MDDQASIALSTSPIRGGRKEGRAVFANPIVANSPLQIEIAAAAAVIDTERGEGIKHCLGRRITNSSKMGGSGRVCIQMAQTDKRNFKEGFAIHFFTL